MKSPNNRIVLGVILGLSLMNQSAFALPPDTKDPRVIAKAVQDRNSGDRIISRIKMTLEDKSGRKRERIVQSRSMDFAAGSKTVLFFESPADVRNTGLLSIDYDDGDKDDDQWLYLPSLHKATRISSSDKSGSFMGTDITYADMTTQDTNDYDYKIVKMSEQVDGEDCWVIESRPRTNRVKKETGYLKTRSWISKKKLMPLQAKMWVKEGKKLKYMKFNDIKQIEGIWIPYKTVVRVTRGKKVESTTVMEYTKVQLNQESVKESDFTERRLEKGL